MRFVDPSERFIRAHSWLCKQLGMELVQVSPDMYVPLSAAKYSGLDLLSHRQWEQLDHPLLEADKTPEPRPEPVKLLEVFNGFPIPLQPTEMTTTTVTAGVRCRPTQLRLIGGGRRQFCVWSVGVNGPSTYALLRSNRQIELVVAEDVWLRPGELLWVAYSNASDTPGEFQAEVWGELDEGSEA